MANVVICDRCGKIIESRTEICSVVIINYMNVTRTFKKDGESTKLNVCKDCYNELKDFIISNQRIKRYFTHPLIGGI